MNRAAFSLPIIVVLLAPASAAEPVLGTEDLPELSDPAGNIGYSPAYIGPKDHDYLDVLAAWYDLNETGDGLVLKFKVADATRIGTPEPEWTPWCDFTANVTDDPSTVIYGIHVEENGTVSGSVSHGENGQWTDRGYVQAIGAADPLESNFAAELTKPGYFRFTVALREYLKMSTGVHEFFALCGEQYQPTQTFGSIPIYNSNIATEEGEYVFPLPSGGADTGGEDEPQLTGSEAPSTSPSVQTGASALGLAAVIVSLAIVARARHR